ncbi:hypothetical protein [Mesorhizobium norvegicum]|uniref:hypothetical protein n=1 Tax=Mesorhizobium norvegicum TaxID=1085774 RepID=UPI0010A95803|nr:hypothetical protein [Mesorhizobium norvegicum]
MPSGESMRAAEQLAAAGVRARISIEPGLGHQVSPSGLAEAGRFFNEVLPCRSAWFRDSQRGKLSDPYVFFVPNPYLRRYVPVLQPGGFASRR